MSESLISQIIESTLPFKNSKNGHLPLKLFETITLLPQKRNGSLLHGILLYCTSNKATLL